MKKVLNFIYTKYFLNINTIVFKDNTGYSEKPITKENRESMAYHVRNLFTNYREVNAKEGWSNDLEDVYRPTMDIKVNYEMAASDAVMR